MSRKNLLLKSLSKKNKQPTIYLLLFLAVLLSITLITFNKNNNLTIISSGLQFLSGSTTATCPAKIDVFDYDLIVNKVTRVKAISNKPGKIEIFAKGLTGTTTDDFVKLKTCDFPGFGVNFCEFYSGAIPNTVNDIRKPLPVTLSGNIVQYYAELTSYNPFEFVQSATKLARIGDQGNTNNYCKDENTIVGYGGADSLGQVCSSAGPGKCNPGYCSRSYSGSGSASCFYPDNCVANDALLTAVSCPTTSSTTSQPQCPTTGTDPRIIGCLSNLPDGNSEENPSYSCPTSFATTAKCYQCKPGFIRSPSGFGCITDTISSIQRQSTTTSTVTVPTMQCPITGTDPTFIGCRSAQYLSVAVTNAGIYPNGACTSPNVCYKCRSGYVRNPNTDLCILDTASTISQQSTQPFTFTPNQPITTTPIEQTIQALATAQRPKIKIFLLENVNSCIVGDPCTDNNCILIKDINNNQVVKSFKGANQGVAIGYIPSELAAEVTDPQKRSSAYCLNLKFSQGDIDAVTSEINTFNKKLVEYSGGKINPNTEIIRINNGGGIRLNPLAPGFWAPIGNAHNLILNYYSRDTDFTFLVLSPKDPDKGVYFDVPICDGAFASTWNYGIPTDAIPMGKNGVGCANHLTFIHGFLHELGDVFNRINPPPAPFVSYGENNYLYNGQRLSCSTRFDNHYSYFPDADVAPLDPDFDSCRGNFGDNWATGYCASLVRQGLDGEECNRRWDKHVLGDHFPPSYILIGNACRNGKQDFDETGVDTGGQCSIYPAIQSTIPTQLVTTPTTSQQPTQTTTQPVTTPAGPPCPNYLDPKNPTFLGCRIAGPWAENAEIKNTYSCPSPYNCYECIGGYTRNPTTDRCPTPTGTMQSIVNTIVGGVNAVTSVVNNVVNTAVNRVCGDGTAYSSCAPNKPVYCDQGTSRNNCQVCGCIEGKICDVDGGCKTPVTAPTQPTTPTGVPCPNIGPENPTFLGCRVPGPHSSVNSEVRDDYVCPPNLNCYECSQGYTRDPSTDSCISSTGAQQTTTISSFLPCPIPSENPRIIGCLSSSSNLLPPNAVEKPEYECTPDLSGNRRCYECPTGFIRGSGVFPSCITDTISSTPTKPTQEVTIVKQQVKCVFLNSDARQKCYTDDDKFGCSEVGACVSDVSGEKGKKLTWKSSCGGYGYTIIDGNSEYVEFKCGEEIPQKDSDNDGVLDNLDKCPNTIPDSFRHATWVCYDGSSESNSPSDDSCRAQEYWNGIARKSCEGHCNKDAIIKCGINKFSVDGACGINIYGCPLPTIKKFTNRLTTDLTNVDLYKVRNLHVGIENIGQVDFGDKEVNLIENVLGTTKSIDLENAFEFTNRKVKVNSELFRELNKSATITLYNITNITNFVINKDGIACKECKIVSYDSDNGKLVFTVEHFSEYSVEGNGSCGDGFCSIQESCSNCQVDCGSCPSSGSSSSGGSGGGGGGSSGGGGKTFRALPANVEVSIVKKVDSLKQGATTELVIADEKSAVTKIVFNVNKEIQSGEVDIEGLISNPISTSPSLKTYKYFQLTKKSISDSDISQTRVIFQVPKSWMASNGITESDVLLYRYNNNNWDKLQTNKIGTNVTYILYEAITSGFSVFAIGAEKKLEQPTEDRVPKNVTPIIEEKKTQKPEEKLVVQTERTIGKTQTMFSSKNFIYYATILLIFIIVILILLKLKGFRGNNGKPIEKKSNGKNMTLDRISSYIERMRSKGKTDQEIKESFIKIGWEEEDLKNYFKK